jgi:lysophospholipase L1-like esterase
MSTVNGCTSQSTWWNTHSSGRAVDKTELYCAGPNFVTAPEILFMGDSDIDYWETTGRFLSSQNVGVGGYTCKNVQKEAQVFLVAFDVPDWLVVVCGENDIASGESVSNTFEQFKKVVAPALIEGTRVLYIGTKPEPDTTSDHSRYRAYDAKVFEYATELASSSSEYDTKAPPLVVIDSYNGFEDNGNPDSFYQNDGLHLSDEGYAFWNTWAGLALADGSCVRWRNSVCVEIQEGGPDGCADDTSWRYKKSSQDCAWTLGKRSRCQRPEGNEEGARTANEACPVTCGTCPSPDGCADDTSWRYKKSSQDCAWTLGKSSRCQRPEGNEEGARTANEACPVTCGTCSI